MRGTCAAGLSMKHTEYGRHFLSGDAYEHEGGEDAVMVPSVEARKLPPPSKKWHGNDKPKGQQTLPRGLFGWERDIKVFLGNFLDGITRTIFAR